MASSRPYLNPSQVMYMDPTRNLQNVFARMGEERLANQKLAQGEAQFGQRMGLDRDKFAALEKQRGIQNAMAKAAAGKAGQGMSWRQKELYKQMMKERGIGAGTHKDYTKSTGGKGGSTASLHGTAQYKGADPDEQGEMDAALVGMMAGGTPSRDALDAVLSNTKKSWWGNPLEDTFYFDN